MGAFYTVIVGMITIVVVLFGIYLVESKISRLRKRLLKKGAKAQAVVESIEQIGGNDTHAFVDIQLKVTEGMSPTSSLTVEIGVPMEDLPKFQIGEELALHYNDGYKIVVGGHLGEILSRNSA